MLALIGVVNHMDLRDIYITFHPNNKGYTFFSVHHETSLKIDQILRNEATLNR